MDPRLKRIFLRSTAILLILHLGYFIYGYLTFRSIVHYDIYTEFYRFKFYDDVSISHFFVTSIFLFVLVIVLIRWRPSVSFKTWRNQLFSALWLMLIALFSVSFFISYSLGCNAKMRTELPEKTFTKDKQLINLLQPFLYYYPVYSSENIFKPEHILYPKPYPVVMERDTIFYNPQNKSDYSTEKKYYSIDTIMLKDTTLKTIDSKTKSILYTLGLDEDSLQKRIISKKNLGDSIQVIYKGIQAYPDHDEAISIFLEDKNLYLPIKSIDKKTQQYSNAVKRYQLLNQYPKDSLIQAFEKLNTIFKKYKIESEIKPADLAQDVFYFRDHRDELFNEIRNNHDRAALKEEFSVLERLFYQPNFLHSNIRGIFFSVWIGVWLFLDLLLLTVGLIKLKKKQVF